MNSLEQEHIDFIESLNTKATKVSYSWILQQFSKWNSTQPKKN